MELLEGKLVKKMPKNPPHRLATRQTYRELDGLATPGWYVDAREPVTFAGSEPEPDVMVVRGDSRQYLGRHPGAGDLGMVVEVADTTLERDRTSKKSLYARVEISVYWIVNLPDKRIEVYTDPSGPGDQPDYRQSQIFRLSDTVPVVIGGQQVGLLAVEKLLP